MWSKSFDRYLILSAKTAGTARVHMIIMAPRSMIQEFIAILNIIQTTRLPQEDKEEKVLGPN